MLSGELLQMQTDHSLQQRTFRTVTTSSLPSSKPDLICSWRHIAWAGLVVSNGATGAER